MRIVLVIGFIVLATNIRAQQKLFIDADESFSFYISGNYTHQVKETDSGTIDILVVNDESLQFKYALTITKAYTENIYTDLLKTSYKQAYLQSCNCMVLNEEQVSYPYFDGLSFLFSKTDSGQLLQGYSVSTIKENYLYNVVYVSTKDSFSIHDEEEFITLLTSFKINDK